MGVLVRVGVKVGVMVGLRVGVGVGVRVEKSLSLEDDERVLEVVTRVVGVAKSSLSPEGVEVSLTTTTASAGLGVNVGSVLLNKPPQAASPRPNSNIGTKPIPIHTGLDNRGDLAEDRGNSSGFLSEEI